MNVHTDSLVVIADIVTFTIKHKKKEFHNSSAKLKTVMCMLIVNEVKDGNMGEREREKEKERNEIERE